MSKKVKDFLNIILNATALGVVVGLIANAVLSTLFKYLEGIFAADLFKLLSQAMYLLQFSVPLLVGVLVGQSLKFKPLESSVLGATVFVASGSLVYNEANKVWTAVPMGDLFNVMFIATIGALIIMLVKDKFGSVTIIFLPIVGGLVAALGLVTLPYMKGLTKFLASIVLQATNFQPIIMCILIAISFAFFMVTPVSCVGMGIILFTNENHIGAGAATLGVVSVAAVMVIGTLRAKNRGASIAILLGAIKLMMPNCARKPQLLLPVFLTAIVTAVSGYFFNILGTHESAGFGIIGLIDQLRRTK